MEPTSLLSIENLTPREHTDRIMAQWEVIRENLKEADKSTVSTFCLYLQILALSLYLDFNTKEARQLLARDETSMLRTFFEKDEHDRPDPDLVDHVQAGHIIALVHGLFEASGGQKSAVWDQFNHAYSAFDNQSICGFIVDATGISSLHSANCEQLYHAILRSKLLPRNKAFTFTMFQEVVQKCQNVINPDRYQRASRGGRAE